MNVVRAFQVPARWYAGSPWLLSALFGLGAVAVAGLLMFVAGGVRLGADSPLYLDGASSVLAGGGIPRGASPYAGYVVFLALITGAGGGLAAIGAVQVLLAGVTAAAVTEVTRRRLGTVAAVVAGVALLAYLDLWRWYGYVLTDALFVSAMAVLLWVLDRAIEGHRGYVAASVVVGLLAATIRPNGWYLGAVIGVYLALSARRSAGRRVLAAAAVVAVVAVGWSFTIETASSYATPSEMLQDGAVIWGWPPGWIDMPEAVGDPGFVGYALSHPVASAGLGLRRVATEMGQIRPYYSAAHNAVIAVVLAPVYLLALVGLPRALRSRTGRLVTTVVAAHLAFIAATFADYDGRFLMYVLPWVVVLAGAGVASVSTILGRGRASAAVVASPAAEPDPGET